MVVNAYCWQIYHQHARLREELESEHVRIKRLRQVNPSIRQEDLDHIAYLMAECSLHIGHASLQLAGLRLTGWFSMLKFLER